MSRDVLMITTIDGAANCARVISEQLGTKVEVASGRRAGLFALRQREYGVVVVEESLAEADPVWADLIWSQAGMAMPVQVNFAISGTARVAREVRSALSRRNNEYALARKAAGIEIQNELKSSVTGLLLESELLLREPRSSATLDARLRHLVELAGTLRERLRTDAGETAA